MEYSYKTVIKKIKKMALLYHKGVTVYISNEVLGRQIAFKTSLHKYKNSENMSLYGYYWSYSELPG